MSYWLELGQMVVSSGKIVGKVNILLFKSLCKKGARMKNCERLWGCLFEWRDEKVYKNINRHSDHFLNHRKRTSSQQILTFINVIVWRSKTDSIDLVSLCKSHLLIIEIRLLNMLCSYYDLIFGWAWFFKCFYLNPGHY